jgi:hypothetical protein
MGAARVVLVFGKDGVSAASKVLLLKFRPWKIPPPQAWGISAPPPPDKSSRADVVELTSSVATTTDFSFPSAATAHDRTGHVEAHR